MDTLKIGVYILGLILIYKQLQVKLPITFKVPCLSAQTPFNCEGALNIVALIGNFTS